MTEGAARCAFQSRIPICIVALPGSSVLYARTTSTEHYMAEPSGGRLQPKLRLQARMAATEADFF
jgi:hypothetical protein